MLKVVMKLFQHFGLLDFSTVFIAQTPKPTLIFT